MVTQLSAGTKKRVRKKRKKKEIFEKVLVNVEET